MSIQTITAKGLVISDPKSCRGLEESFAATAKPPLKWAGGKRWQLPHLRPLWKQWKNRRLVEPFCGGLAIALGLSPERALVNDVNPHLINFYQWLKKGLSVSTVPLLNSRTRYYANRERFNSLIERGRADGEEGAVLFYYLNRTGYNGLCRFNGSGQFNVPFGRYSKIAYTSDFSPYQKIFAAWDFVNLDFEKVPLESNDFVYADPPYDVEFTQYASQPFGWDAQVRTARWLARHQGPVVLSNQATPRIVCLYRGLGFHLTFLSAPRRISCTGDRAPACEVLAIRNINN